MPGSRSIARLLERHKEALSRELESTNVLRHLCKKGVISDRETDSILSASNGDRRADAIVELFSQKGFNVFRELCVTLELECPHLLTALLLDNGSRHPPGKIPIYSLFSSVCIINYQNKMCY